MPKLEEALQHHQAGRLQEAKRLYRQILEGEPNHADALHLLGVIALQSDQPDTAMGLIEHAIKHRQDVPEYHLNLGSALRQLGRLDDAAASCQRALTLRPNYADAYNNLGLVRQAQGKLTQAVSAYRDALASAPDDPEIHNNLGVILQEQGKLPEAIAALRHALNLSPHYAPARTNLGTALASQGKFKDAIAAHQQALAEHPDLAQAHYNLGVALEATDEHEQAAQAFRNVLKLAPDHTDSRKALVTVLQQLNPSAYRRELDDEIKAIIASATVNPQDLAGLTARQLICKYRVTTRLHSEPDALILDLATDELMTTLLTRTVNVEPSMEAAIAAIRHRLLLEHYRGDTISAAVLPLTVAIALQCFNNEYLIDASAREKEIVDEIENGCARLAETTAAPTPRLEQNLLLVALYRPLHAVDFAPALNALSTDSWSHLLRPLIQRTLREPLEERRIASTIESLGETKDATSNAVRAQYEESPYPRWLELPRVRNVDMQTFLRREFPHFTLPAFLNDTAKLLVAGCGTGQEPLAIALQNNTMEIVALDFSRSSLAYAIRMAQTLDVRNVRFLHADILALLDLGQCFHVIECAGVLHHMADPLHGWRILTDLLAPGGLMQVSLYSEHARETIVTARERISKLGLTALRHDISAFRNRILNGDEPKLSELTASEDFYSISACRDMLFHVNEHRFTLRQISQALDALDLAFIGFELPRPQVKQAYRAFCPGDTSMTDLNTWNAFEQRYPRTFWGMYAFWCQKL
ncbi:MAG: tetratricopeptide repeat protein [Acidiferrobacterales bacterium]